MPITKRGPLAVALALLAGCASQPPLKTAAHVDLDRYMGTWYVIGAIPNVFERGKVATADEYQRRPDGRIGITYHYRSDFAQPAKTWHGVAWLPEPADASRWKVQLLWPFRTDYQILQVTPEYDAVAVGLPSRKLLWIMARERQLAPAQYQRLLQDAAAQGFPVEQVRKVPQRVEDIGQPGFQ